jgi:hypothetical protein
MAKNKQRAEVLECSSHSQPKKNFKAKNKTKPATMNLKKIKHWE